MNAPLELWAGPECTVNRVGERWRDQLAHSGFARRLSDIDRLASLGVRRVRFPLLWERTAPRADASPDWSWAQPRVERLQALGVGIIAGLLHHGSGPRHAGLLDAHFPGHLAAYALAAARQFPHIEDWTPVNEPLTTARFAALYGLWHPHRRDDASFVRALLNQVRGIAQAMAAIRTVNPGARLVQTEDLGLTTTASPALQPQADFDNERRWLSLDLLAGRVAPGHPLRRWLLQQGAQEAELDELCNAPCLPQVVGINHYVTSERFLDDRLHLYPRERHGGNGRQRYVDLETARVHGTQIGGFEPRLREAAARYGQPVAITEAHLGCTREEQLRWLHQAWQAARHLKADGVAVQAVTAWAAFGAHDWDSLLTREHGRYEPGLWDASSEPPRPTALAKLATQLARGQAPDHPVLAGPGWWQRELRLEGPCAGELQSVAVCGRPLLVTGATGTLGQAYARLCVVRGLPYHLLSRAEMDIADAASVEAALERWQPWAVVNAAGHVRVDAGEREDGPRLWRENVAGAATLARACARRGVRLLSFSSDLVFDGEAQRPYVEHDLPRPLNAYGRSKLEAEQQVLALAPTALVVRTAAFFGPWDPHNFVTQALAALRRGEGVIAPCDQRVSPTYLPDLVNASLDLLVDGERGLWHLANGGAVSWDTLARMAAEGAGLDHRQVRGAPAHSLGQHARRPRFSALASARGHLMPSLEDGLRRYLALWQPQPEPPPRSLPPAPTITEAFAPGPAPALAGLAYAHAGGTSTLPRLAPPAS